MIKTTDTHLATKKVLQTEECSLAFPLLSLPVFFCKMDGQDYRVKIWVVQLPCKVKMSKIPPKYLGQSDLAKFWALTSWLAATELFFFSFMCPHTHAHTHTNDYMKRLDTQGSCIKHKETGWDERLYHFLYEGKLLAIRFQSCTEETLFSVCPKITTYRDKEGGERARGRMKANTNRSSCNMGLTLLPSNTSLSTEMRNALQLRKVWVSHHCDSLL